MVGCPLCNNQQVAPESWVSLELPATTAWRASIPAAAAVATVAATATAAVAAAVTSAAEAAAAGLARAAGDLYPPALEACGKGEAPTSQLPAPPEFVHLHFC